MLHHSNWTIILSISFSPMRTLFFSYWTKYFPNTLWYIIFPTTNKNVLKCLRWGSDVLKFSLNWGSAMFLRCSYFFQNLSLDVLINKVLIQNNACSGWVHNFLPGMDIEKDEARHIAHVRTPREQCEDFAWTITGSHITNTKATWPLHGGSVANT